MVKNGIYAQYKGLIFAFVYIDEIKCKLISRDGEPVGLGFQPYSQDNSVYIKIVNLSDLEAIYKIGTKALYKGHEFDVENQVQNQFYILNTMITRLGKQFCMDVRGKNEYSLLVPIEDVDKIWEVRERLQKDFFGI